MENNNELWKDIPGYEGLYQVSNMGRVKSLGNGGTHKSEKILKPHKPHGYYQAVLFKNGIKKHFKVHRLVAEAFIPNDDPEHKTQVNHRDENKQNNTVWFKDDGSIDLDKTNLEWCTCQYNNTYGTARKRAQKTRNNKKAKNAEKPVKQMNLDGTIVKIWPSTAEAQRNGFNACDIVMCANGRKNYKTHRGFRWVYV